MNRFSGCISVITGAGSGIGKAAAIRLAQEGSKVILVGRTREKLMNVADEIHQSAPESAGVYVADVTDEHDVTVLAQYVKSTYGDLHVLINNAGGSFYSSVSHLPAEEWDQVFALNLRSVFLVSKLLGHVMISAASREDSNQRKDRAIVNVASLSGHKPGARIPHYSASKAAVINFTKALAGEYAPYGIRVNSVSPGFVETPLTEKGLQNDSFVEAIKRHTALKRVGRPDEIANVIAFLASQESSYMTGSDVLVDGGWLIT
ncbi:SDR family NAD(P)-dependent oxidoreductase [Lihuaxuella thermophila]|uniref:3-oxoacyl-[acyl-carrier protein] reductase n=1 Tax=Lihuaxuella thermophila TaxID=1173111 RepID=A0A1H8CAC1_9BACL|nr:SDR family oxidoreductase [Lihuaxuella thermophila]SEM91404.1 3-oxoacyl-[acyl-carrier protein] reductase [Lihuaxuella thermophila]